MRELDFNKVLRDFQYKPNVGFHAYEKYGQWWIRIVMLVEDARAPFRPWEPKPVPEDEFGYFDNDYRRRYHYPSSGNVGYSPSRELMEVVGNYAIPPFVEGDDDNFVSWLVYSIKSVESHEQDEWLRYKGELINDPHKRD